MPLPGRPKKKSYVRQRKGKCAGKFVRARMGDKTELSSEIAKYNRWLILIKESHGPDGLCRPLHHHEHH